MTKGVSVAGAEELGERAPRGESKPCPLLRSVRKE